MVMCIKTNSRNYFKCEECGLLYNVKAIAEKCQKWCAEYKSCNLDIIRHSVRINEDKDEPNGQ